MTLSLYLLRRFFVSLLIVGGIFAGILMLIDMVEQIRKLSGTEGAGIWSAAEIALLNLSGGIYGILPLIVLFGAIAMFLALARSSELVVIRAAGRSALRAVAAPVFGALVLGVACVALLNPMVASTARVADEVLTRLAGGNPSVLSVTSEGLWLRQGSAEGQVVIRAARANHDGTHLYGVSFLAFDPEGLPVSRIEAEEAILKPGTWELHRLKEWQFSAANPEKTAVTAEIRDLATDLSPGKIRESFNTPDAIAIWELPAFIDGLERAGFSAQKHRVWLQRELALPLTLAAMVLLAAGFTMSHARGGRTGVRVLMAVLAGFAVFFLRNFAQVLGENGQIPVDLAAWAPPTVAVLAALGLLLHLEDG